MVGRAGLALVVIAVGLAVVDIVSGFALLGWGVLASILILIVGAALWGVGRYSRIELRPNELRAGRQRYVPSDFDAVFGVRDIDALTSAEQATLLRPWPISKRSTVQLAGGAWAPPAGLEVIVLRAAAGNPKIAVASRKAGALSVLLVDWLGPPHDQQWAPPTVEPA